MTTPSFPMPYTVEYNHGSSVYLSIPSSQRNGSTSNHYLSPGQYEIIASYQGNETMTVQFLTNGSLTGNITVTPPSSTVTKDAQQADPVTVIVKDGDNGGLRVYTTPRTSDLTDTSGVGSLLIIPTPRYGDV